MTIAESADKLNRAMELPEGVSIAAPVSAEYQSILTFEALSHLAQLHRQFEPRRRELLAARVTRAAELDAGKPMDFLADTLHVREGNWKIASLPKALERRRIEITGPTERKMIINALNAGADSYMSDFEDSNSPSWDNQIQGQINLRDAVRGTISVDYKGKEYKLNEKVAVLQVRPRGWHLDEKHVTVDGQRVSGGLFDFWLYFYHNAKELIARGAGPFFYLPKLQSHREARLWNDVFVAAQKLVGIPQGTIKATVLIETLHAAFEMDEILYELREHSAGLNAGRWDYIFSCIKVFRNNRDFCLADRSKITMTVPFMRAYALSLIKTCHKRGAPAIGGMSALIPNKKDPEANEKAMAGIRSDKRRDATDGYDGGWVAHPGLVEAAMEEFVAVLGDKPNQIEKQLDVNYGAADLQDFRPEGPISETGLRTNINVGIQYLGAWMDGNGCVPIHGLMEDAATAEISRAQVWSWIRSPKGILDDGRKVTADMVRGLIPQELDKIRALLGDAYTETYARAATLFGDMCVSTELEDFLTLPAYERME